jgi:hypothetical protein
LFDDEVSRTDKNVRVHRVRASVQIVLLLKEMIWICGLSSMITGRANIVPYDAARRAGVTIEKYLVVLHA